MALIKLPRFAQKLNNLRKFLLYGKKYSVESYVNELRKRGAKIDDTFYIQTPETVYIDDTVPFMLTIGKNVIAASGVTILTHDACWLAQTSQNGRITGHNLPVTIGNNVFLGINSTVLCGVEICDNVIVGANSVVSRSITEPGVYVGNPVKLATSLESFFARRNEKQLDEAYVVAKKYYEAFGKKPPEEVLNEYFWLYAPRRADAICQRSRKQMDFCGNPDLCMQAFLQSEPQFESYDAFWEYCVARMKKERG